MINPRFLIIGLNPSIDYFLHCKNLKINEKNLIGESQLIPGGKGVNVASCLAKQSDRVSLLGFIGEKDLDIFTNSILIKDVKKSFISIPGTTRVNYKVMDDVNGECTEFNLTGFHVSEEKTKKIFHFFEKQVNQCDFVSISGSLPPGVPPDFYSNLIHLIRKKNVQCGLDTSGRELYYGVEAIPDILRINVSEMGELINKEIKTIHQIVQATEMLHRKGIKLVVVSMGKYGAIANNGSEIWQAIPPKIKAIKLIGAGDAMMAGCIFEYAIKSPIKTILTNAVALATAYVANENFQQINIRQVNELSRRIQLKQIH